MKMITSSEIRFYVEPDGPERREAGVPPKGWDQPQLSVSVRQTACGFAYCIHGGARRDHWQAVKALEDIPVLAVISWQPWAVRRSSVIIQVFTDTAMEPPLATHAECIARHGKPPQRFHFAIVPLPRNLHDT